jgi:hypothetical protein
VTILTDQIVYTYHFVNLLVSYLSAGFVTLLGIFVGLYAIHLNGAVHSNSFSAVVSSTRNITLDALFYGQSLGDHSLSKEVLQRKLRFGMLIPTGGMTKSLAYSQSSGIPQVGQHVEANQPNNVRDTDQKSTNERAVSPFVDISLASETDVTDHQNDAKENGQQDEATESLQAEIGDQITGERTQSSERGAEYGVNLIQQPYGRNVHHEGRLSYAAFGVETEIMPLNP